MTQDQRDIRELERLAALDSPISISELVEAARTPHDPLVVHAHNRRLLFQLNFAQDQIDGLTRKLSGWKTLALAMFLLLVWVAGTRLITR